MHSTGLAFLRVDATRVRQIAEFTSSIRQFLAPTAGTVVLLKAPSLVRQKVDVWGDVGFSMPLMRRIKEQFDPRGILNPGRYVGGL